jgi:hypothetical protein
MSTVPEKINEIEALAKKLNMLSVELNPLIKKLNESLRPMNVGVEVWIDPPLETLTGAVIQLGFGRTDETHCDIAVRSIDRETSETKWTRPLIGCSRETRIAAVARLPQLLTEILQKLDKEAANAESARTELPNLIEIFEQQTKQKRGK